MTFAIEKIDPATWPEIHAILAPGLARAEYTTTELIDDLLSSMAQLWVLRKGGDPIAVAVTELVVTAVGTIVHVRLIVGSGLSGWFRNALDCVTQFARENGAIRLTVKGRKGWERLLRKMGWRFGSVVMELPIGEIA